MDISFNITDAQYFTNSRGLNKLLNKNKDFEIPKRELEFYKKRIFQLTKDMLRGEKTDSPPNKAFINYAQCCIKHFKFIDKMELIQKEYDKVDMTSTEDDTIFDMGTSNKLILRKNKPVRPKITDHINIQSNQIKKPLIVPKSRHFNLKDPKFREKGLKKKNIINK